MLRWLVGIDPRIGNMMSDTQAERWLNLTCHPSAQSEAARKIKARVRRTDAELRIGFRLDGEVSRIKVPRPRAPRLGSELWRHTCFETFIALEGQRTYHEFNFAPSGEWTVYAFGGYRNGSPMIDEAMRPEITVRTTDKRLALDARVRLDTLSATHLQASLCIGLAAVIEDNDRLTHWALRHPADRPDFHHADGFALLLEPPRRRMAAASMKATVSR